MYVKPPLYLRPGMAVEHKNLPGVPLKIVSGPEQGLAGELYWVEYNNKAVRVKKCNLIY